MSSILLSLYHKTISSLHQSVENDPALKIMDAPQLLRYKIDRVNELVKQIFNSEKEQIIIYLLNMCENNTENKYIQDYQYQGKESNQKQIENQIKILREEAEMLKKQLVEEKQKGNEHKFQIQQLQSKYNKLEISYSQKQSQDENREKQLRAQRILLDEKEQIIQLFRQKNLKLQQEINYIRQQLEKQITQTRSYKSQVQQFQTKLKQKIQPMRLKVERIESIKKQMGSLFIQLHANKEIVCTLKQNIGSIIKKDLLELRKDCETLKFELINVFFKTIKTDFQQLKKQWEKRYLFEEQKTQKEHQFLLQQMNQIQKQMDGFISTKIKNI